MVSKDKIKLILEKVGTILEVIFIAFIVLFCVISVCQRVLSKDKSFFGYRIFNIVTKSMEPKLKVGDIILVEDTDIKDIKRGDIISYQGMTSELSGKIITHQVKNFIDENGKRIFYTQGINSDTMDPAVYEEQIYGVVTHKFYVLSFINRIITSTLGFILCVVIPLVYIFILELKTIAEERSNARYKEEEIKREEVRALKQAIEQKKSQQKKNQSKKKLLDEANEVVKEKKQSTTKKQPTQHKKSNNKNKNNPQNKGQNKKGPQKKNQNNSTTKSKKTN